MLSVVLWVYSMHAVSCSVGVFIHFASCCVYSMHTVSCSVDVFYACCQLFCGCILCMLSVVLWVYAMHAFICSVFVG